MHNPFQEDAATDPPDEELVRAAQAGSRESLERLIRRHQAWLYNIVVRMVWSTHRAEDVTQEILVKIVTGLGGFQGRSKFRTWAYRIAVNHVLNVGPSEMERQGVTFTDMGRELDETPDRPLPEAGSVPVPLSLLVEEARVGCSMAMLMCLDRRQRLVFTLGEIFGVSDAVGAELLDLTPANFRQLLSRARKDLYSFMNDKCGLVRAENPCRCVRKTRGFIEKGYLDPSRLKFSAQRQTEVQAVAPNRLAELDSIVDRLHAAVFRTHAFLPVADQVEVLRPVLTSPAFRRATGD